MRSYNTAHLAPVNLFPSLPWTRGSPVTHNLKRISLPFIAASVLGLFSVAPPARAAEPSDQATELFRQSGLGTQLAMIDQQIIGTISSQGHQIPLGTRKLLIQVVGETYSGEALKAEALAILSQEIDPVLAEQTLTWLGLPETREIEQLEEASGTPGWKQGLLAHSLHMQQKPPEPARMALVKRLDAVGGTTEASIEVAAGTAFAVFSALNAAAGYPMTLEVLGQRVATQAAQMRQTIHQQVIEAFLYTYRDVSDEALGRYVDFLETEVGQWYCLLIRRSMTGAMGAAAKAMGETLEKELEESGRR